MGKKYILAPAIIPFIIGISISGAAYLHQVNKNNNLEKELRGLIKEKNEEIDDINAKLEYAEPFLKMDEEERKKIEEEYYRSVEELKQKEENKKEEQKKENEKEEISKSDSIYSEILYIEEQTEKAKDILDRDAINLKSGDEVRGKIASEMKSFGISQKPFIVGNERMSEEELHRIRINNIYSDLQGYMCDAGSAFLLHINSTDEVEKASGSSSYVTEKGLANSQLSKLEREIESYKDKYME